MLYAAVIYTVLSSGQLRGPQVMQQFADAQSCYAYVDRNYLNTWRDCIQIAPQQRDAQSGNPIGPRSDERVPIVENDTD